MPRDDNRRACFRDVPGICLQTAAAGAGMCWSRCGIWAGGEEETLESLASWGKENIDAAGLVQIPSPVQVS